MAGIGLIIGVGFSIFYDRDHQDDLPSGVQEIIGGEGKDKANYVLNVIGLNNKGIQQDGDGK